MTMRIDRLLSEAGFGTRSEVKKAIRLGKVTIDGEVCKDPGMKADPDKMAVCYEQTRVLSKGFTYIMLNKCTGVVSAVSDRNTKTVVDLVRGVTGADVFPVGRLDIDTTGLLLLTDDGELAHRLLSPRRHVDKVYEALIDTPVSEEMIARFEEGFSIGDEKDTLPAKLEDLGKTDEGYLARVTIHEGRFHQVKRMFLKQGSNVLSLKRLSMGTLRLDESLQEGECRFLTRQEIDLLKNI